MLPLIIERIESQWGARAHANVMRLHTFGLGESNAQQLINSSGFEWPKSVELGFRASAPTMEIKLTVADTKDLPEQQSCADHIATLFGDHILGVGETSIGQSMVELLSERGITLTTAESCTGGLIASLITQIPGSSKAFHAGFVTYDNAIKSSVLGVRQSDLDQYGAVSKTVVEQMALGALRASNADYAIAVSGIAGPDGGTIDKQLGRVWIAYGSSSDLRTIELTWPLPRVLFQTMVAAAALDLLRRHILELPLTAFTFNSAKISPRKSIVSTRGSGLELLYLPLIILVFGVSKAVMQTINTPLPELYSLWDNSITAPEIRHRNRTLSKLCLHRCQLLL